MEIEYFGTNLSQAGHGFYILESDFHTNSSRFDDFPFNPESLPYAGRKRQYIDGTVRFYNFAGFTIIAIAGSPYDKRPGSKSIFFTEEDLTREVFEARLKENPMVQKIIKKMPFDVKW